MNEARELTKKPAQTHLCINPKKNDLQNSRVEEWPSEVGVGRCWSWVYFLLDRKKRVLKRITYEYFINQDMFIIHINHS